MNVFSFSRLGLKCTGNPALTVLSDAVGIGQPAKGWAEGAGQAWCSFDAKVVDQGSGGASPSDFLRANMALVPDSDNRTSRLWSHVFLSLLLEKITLQSRVGFCHTTVQISHNHTYTASLPFPITPLWKWEARLGFLCDIAASQQLSVLHMVGCACQCCFLHLGSCVSCLVSLPDLELGFKQANVFELL